MGLTMPDDLAARVKIPSPFLDATTKNFCVEHGLAHRSVRAPHEGERMLGAFKLPPFQRPSVWMRAQKVRFIESIWLRLPIASYVINEDDQDHLNYPCDDWLLDGQQRWTAIVGYVADEFEVFGGRFSDLTEVQRRKFKNHPFPAIVTRNLTEQQCLEVYNRLAYGGTNHVQ